LPSPILNPIDFYCMDKKALRHFSKLLFSCFTEERRRFEKTFRKDQNLDYFSLLTKLLGQRLLLGYNKKKKKRFRIS